MGYIIIQNPQSKYIPCTMYIHKYHAIAAVVYYNPQSILIHPVAKLPYS